MVPWHQVSKKILGDPIAFFSVLWPGFLIITVILAFVFFCRRMANEDFDRASHGFPEWQRAYFKQIRRRSFHAMGIPARKAEQDRWFLNRLREQEEAEKHKRWKIRPVRGAPSNVADSAYPFPLYRTTRPGMRVDPARPRTRPHAGQRRSKRSPDPRLDVHESGPSETTEPRWYSAEEHARVHPEWADSHPERADSHLKRADSQRRRKRPHAQSPGSKLRQMSRAYDDEDAAQARKELDAIAEEDKDEGPAPPPKEKRPAQGGKLPRGSSTVKSSSARVPEVQPESCDIPLVDLQPETQRKQKSRTASAAECMEPEVSPEAESRSGEPHRVRERQQQARDAGTGSQPSVPPNAGAPLLLAASAEQSAQLVDVHPEPLTRANVRQSVLGDAVGRRMLAEAEQAEQARRNEDMKRRMLLEALTKKPGG